MAGVDEGARSGGHARVRLRLIIITDSTMLIDTSHMRSGSLRMLNSCAAFGDATTLWPPTARHRQCLWRMCLQRHVT